MANLTITVEPELLRRARIKALEQGTSVNALLREYLEGFAGVSPAHRRAIDALLELSEQVTSARAGRRWTRDELHER
jgi:hypothetical protein